jgi:hypothetical protein
MSERPVSLAGEPKVSVEQARVFGLAPDEYRKIEEIIGRTPTYTELGVFSVMWSAASSAEAAVEKRAGGAGAGRERGRDRCRRRLGGGVQD